MILVVRRERTYESETTHSSNGFQLCFRLRVRNRDVVQRCFDPDRGVRRASDVVHWSRNGLRDPYRLPSWQLLEVK